MSIPGPKVSCILKSVAASQGTGGDPAKTETTRATFKVAFQPVSAQERLQYDKETVIPTHRVWVNHSSVGTANAAYMIQTSRMTIGGTTYDITSVIDYGAGTHYEVLLKEGEA